MPDELICGECFKKFPQRKVDAILCTNCKYWVHKSCTQLSKQDYEQAAKEKDSYRCNTCTLTSKGDMSAMARLISRSQMVMSEKFETVAKDLGGLKGDIGELKEEVMKYKDEVEKIKTAMDFVNKEHEDQRTKILSLSNELAAVKKLTGPKLYSEIAATKVTVNQLSQYSRKNNLLIHGVPAEEREDDDKVLQSIATVLKFFAPDVSVSRDVEIAHRIFSQNRNVPKPIIVKFFSVRVKQKVLAAFKVKRKTFAQQNVSGNASVKKNISIRDILPDAGADFFVYITEHMTRESKLLLDEVYAELDGIAKFKWFQDGRVMVRKSENSRVIYVNSMEDIPNIRRDLLAKN